jgi:hypothetical protein
MASVLGPLGNWGIMEGGIAKLQANDRTHAVVTALRRGLVEL